MSRKWIKEKGKGKTITDKILEIRGITDRDRFLYGKVSDLYDISLLQDGLKAVDILKDAIEKKEKICIYTDYDTDGASGGSVALLMLRELGANVIYYTNNRFAKGYGMCVEGVNEVLSSHPDVKLFYTIDNGISQFEASSYVKSLGLKLIITDHHDAGEVLPEADAIVNPKRRDSVYPFQGICGAVVSWKVLRELYDEKREANKYLDILAIATVGDVVPLVDENRIIVKEGLKLLRNGTRLSLEILREMTDTTEISSHFTLGFIYSPIFNAISRLDGDIDLVIEMLISDDEDFIRDAITKLININEERKTLTLTQLEEAERALDEKGLKEVIVLFSENFHEGIVGLIAGRLKEKYNRPTIVLTKGENGNIKGSCRSIEAFDIKENLDKCSDLLLGYGGHTLAAGLSLSPKNLDEFEERLVGLAKDSLTEDDFIKRYYYIDTLKERDVTISLVEELEMLEPYGEGFRKPLLKLDGFDVRRCFVMGKEKEHIKLAGKDISLIAWRMAEDYESKGSPLQVTALGYPELNIYKNNVSVQFMINEDNFF